MYLSGEVKTRQSRTEDDRSRPTPPQLIPSPRLAETTVASTPILAPLIHLVASILFLSGLAISQGFRNESDRPPALTTQMAQKNKCAAA